MRKTQEDAYGLLDDMALNAFSWNFDRSARKPSGIHIISTQTTLVAQVETLQRQLNQMNAQNIKCSTVNSVVEIIIVWTVR